MPRLPIFIQKTLSIKLSLIVVLSMAMLLLASLGVMMHFAQKTLIEESLQKGGQALEATVQHIDNILLSVEQTAGNFYFHALPKLDDQEKLLNYSRHLVESNPYVVGCAIAIKPNYYNDGKSFMAYYLRTDSGKIERMDKFANGPYTDQEWYLIPMRTGRPEWMKPLGDRPFNDDNLKKNENISIITFCLPIYGRDYKTVGVMGVDVSLKFLSKIVLAAKPSPNSYCTLIDRDGAFIVHPDSSRLFYQSVYELTELGADTSVVKAAKSMMSGETGYCPIQMEDDVYYVFFKPFKQSVLPGRAMVEMGWSAGIVYPEDDIFGDYYKLRYYVLAIAIVGLLVLLLLCYTIIHRQLLPLKMLTRSAQRIANGHYDETIPDSRQKDEIGRLQDNFQQMQKSLANHIGSLEQMTTDLEERGKVLSNAYQQVQKAERMKLSFLHNITKQIIGPAETINKSVITLVKHLSDKKKKGDSSLSATLAEDIQKNGNTIAKLLANLINLSDEERRKEDDHV